MKKLSKDEAEKEVFAGAGILSFFGGFSSKNGKEILCLNDGDYLFEHHEVNGEEWDRMKSIQDEECKKYIESILRNIESILRN
jgi:hypothetical protein